LLIKKNNGVADQKNTFADQNNNSADHFTNSHFFFTFRMTGNVDLSRIFKLTRVKSLEIKSFKRKFGKLCVFLFFVTLIFFSFQLILGSHQMESAKRPDRR
jgi:hypothetical protein